MEWLIRIGLIVQNLNWFVLRIPVDSNHNVNQTIFWDMNDSLHSTIIYTAIGHACQVNFAYMQHTSHLQETMYATLSLGVITNKVRWYDPGWRSQRSCLPQSSLTSLVCSLVCPVQPFHYDPHNSPRSNRAIFLKVLCDGRSYDAVVSRSLICLIGLTMWLLPPQPLKATLWPVWKGTIWL